MRGNDGFWISMEWVQASQYLCDTQFTDFCSLFCANKTWVFVHSVSLWFSHLNWFFLLRVEFAALLLNTNSGLVESVFHHFVRPTHFPTLSDYCTKQTGLSQSFIDQQKPFSDVYNKFLAWLRQHIVKRNLVFATPLNSRQTSPANAELNATFCTWSDWDLGHYLYRDCIRNEISRYECMKAWIDIRRAFDVSVDCFPFTPAVFSSHARFFQYDHFNAFNHWIMIFCSFSTTWCHILSKHLALI